MERKNLVSVIIPTYNRSHYLARAINSALAQKYSPLEIIVVDDGSTDNTPNVIASFRDQIIPVRQDNMGVSAARNLGLQIARGEYIAFLDSDDFWAEEKLLEQIRTLEEHPDCDVSYTWWTTVDEHGHFKRFFHPNAEGSVFQQLYFSSYALSSHILARRKCFYKEDRLYLLFDTDLAIAEDLKVWLQLSLKHRFRCVKKYLVFCTEHHGSSIKSLNICQLLNSLRSVETFLIKDPLASERLRKWGKRATAAWHVKCSYMYFVKGNRKEALKGFLSALVLCPTYKRTYLGIFQCIIGRRPVDKIIRVYDLFRYQ
jgi:glycosyltransferase involved in cell wall biosynthesis